VQPTSDPDISTDLRQPTWGLGDVALGIVISLVASVVAVSIAVGIAGWATNEEIPLWGQALLQIPLWTGYLGVAWWAGRTKGNGAVIDFGITMRPLDVPLGLVIGVALQIVVLPLLYWPILELSGKTPDDLSRPAEDLAAKAGAPVGWILLALIVGVGAPIVEEIFYRGLLYRSLRKKQFPIWVSTIVSAAIFGGIHFQPLQLAGLFVFGVVAALLAERTGRLGPSMWTHVGFNLTTVLILYLS
jgi:uncharacterized protein